MHKIIIERVNQGWIVTVGCQRLVFTDPDTMKTAFSDYLKDPEKARTRWCDVPPSVEEVQARPESGMEAPPTGRVI